MGKIENIAAYSLDKYIDECKEDYVLVDVRDNSKFNQRHIKGAINLYYKEIMLGNYNLPKDKIIILYCDRGGLSMQVARYLSERDYNVKNVVGGLNEYTIEKNKNS